jgi:chitinase
MVRVLRLVPLALALVVSSVFASPALAVDCSGLAEWSCSTSYGLGASVRFNGSKYTLCAACSRAASCPGFSPAADNWWTNNGVCDGGTSPTPTPTPTNPPSATPTPTPTSPGPTATPSPTPTMGPGPTATPTPTPTTPTGGDVEVTPGSSAVTASANDGNLPGNTVDNSWATRWSANGDGHWIRFDLGTTRTVTRVRIAWYSGNVRQGRFDLQTSNDAVSWSNAITGGLSSGTTTAEQNFDITDTAARYVRYLGHGNTVNSWNSLYEVSIFATSAGTLPTATPTPTSPGATPTPTPTPTPVQPTATPTPSPTACGSCGGSIPRHALVGYWHNFDNGSGFIKLRDVSSQFDVIQVAFAEPTSATSGDIRFVPYSGTTAAEIRSDIGILHSRGKKVLISIGGANGQVQLASSTARTNFVNSVTSIIRDYGFDGLDIDFEGHSLFLNSGDGDFRSPTTPVITNLISAIRSIKANIGGNFVLTMAPETFFVQLGYSFYGGTCAGCDNRAGSYLPVIHALRNDLNILHVQHYNSGPITGLDNQYHTMGSADFHVAMADMMLTGFTVANTGIFFPALRQDQVAIGLPANQNAGGGFTPVGEVHTALNYLYKGQVFGSYRLRGASSYPNMRGLMTWSINWDRFNNFEFSNQHGNYLDALP